MKQIIIELIAYRDLLLMLTLRDIKVRYKQASMGFLWAIFMPIVAVSAGILIKKTLAVASQTSLDMEKSIFSLAVKVLPWTFFVSSIRFAVQSLVGNSSLVTKIYFPRAVLPLSAILACLFDFALAAGVLAVILTFMNVGISIHILWLPVLLLFLLLFICGTGILLSAINLFFRDIKYIVEVILMFGIFFTPVFYPAEAIGRWKNLLLLNPVGSLLEAINAVVVMHRQPDLGWVAYAAFCSIILFWFGLVTFKKKEPYFVENI